MRGPAPDLDAAAARLADAGGDPARRRPRQPAADHRPDAREPRSIRHAAGGRPVRPGDAEQPARRGRDDHRDGGHRFAGGLRDLAPGDARQERDPGRDARDADGARDRARDPRVHHHAPGQAHGHDPGPDPALHHVPVAVRDLAAPELLQPRPQVARVGRPDGRLSAASARCSGSSCRSRRRGSRRPRSSCSSAPGTSSCSPSW